MDTNEECGLRPFVFTDRGSLSAFSGFPEGTVQECDLMTKRWVPHTLARIARHLDLNDPFLPSFLRKNGIDVVSHAHKLSSVPTIGWIPDFQHLHLPHFFEEKELSGRSKEYQDDARRCNRIIVSSHDALKDLASFAPESIGKASVLQFVASPPSLLDPLSVEEMNLRSKVGERYFILPNQFWVHKNHGVVIDALAIAKESVPGIVVVATGAQKDYRNPNYYGEIENRVRSRGVAKNFIATGVVSRSMLWYLIFDAIAVINPSRFEGWSTSVEEAKSIGKSIILSDIATHVEQAPKYSSYFNVDDPATLADQLVAHWKAADPAEDKRRQEEAKGLFPQRQKEFSATYERIVRQTYAEGCK